MPPPAASARSWSSWGKALGRLRRRHGGLVRRNAPSRVQAGCDIAIDYTKPDWVKDLLEATGGRKARVVYDSVGKTTFLQSLDLTAPFGLVVSYGAASGPAPDISMDLLNKKGCLYVTRPSVFPHNADPATFPRQRGGTVRGDRSGRSQGRYRRPLQARSSHRGAQAAEARATTGPIVILP